MKSRKGLAIGLVLIFTVLTSCNNAKTGNKSEVKVNTVDELLETAESVIDSVIYVKGHVTHTCKHSGKRCFIVGEDESLTIRIEAGETITGFDRELVGNAIKVKGKLKERRLSKEYIDQYEEEVKAKAIEEDGSAETCASEMGNITNMRNWMKEKGKDYYAIYYIEGYSYEVLE